MMRPAGTMVPAGNWKQEIKGERYMEDNILKTPESDAFLELADIVKIYGNTVANDHIGLKMQKGDILGLVGANGAGKSTLMRIISGVTVPEEGNMAIGGEKIAWKQFTPSKAGALGIRVAYQELSLCDNLKVYENFFVELPDLFKKGRNWRKKAIETARAQLELVFPGNGIDVTAELSELSIAQQQMIEIARAFTAPNLRLLILDEPTSSLPIEQTKQLLSFVKKRAQEGVTFIYITHRLFEIMEITNQICILKNGAVVWEGKTAQVTEDFMIGKMGSAAETKDNSAAPEETHGVSEKNERISVKFSGMSHGILDNINGEIYGGEIIGIAGLEGNGQKELLQAIFHAPYALRGCMQRKGSVAYVTGNRKEEGNFPLWSIADNIAITSKIRGSLFKFNSGKKTLEQSAVWYDKLKVKGDTPKAGITSLSGGNQQKVLIARALLADADIIILDDPTRGVDIDTKRQLYEVFREAAEKGKLVIWYSSDDSELDICSRVFVMRYGTVVAELPHGRISKDTIIEASFKAKREAEASIGKKHKRLPAFVIPVLSLIAVYTACGLIQKNTFTVFGAELLISGSLPLLIATLGQVFIIGLSHTDLGIGNFMGLVSVITATVMYEKPIYGIAAVFFAVILYAMMGLLICVRNIPAVIVTLGGSFIWTGAAFVLQSMPGGSSPAPLSMIFNGRLLGIPNVILIAALAAAAATLIYRSGYGTVLRGFGNNEVSMMRSGWSKKKAFVSIYLCSACFAAVGGMAFTAITYSSDAEAMNSYTLLTVAAVILGGGSLTGGRVNHIGAMCGALTLSLVTILLGFLHVSTDLTAAVQGFLLIVILSLRLLKKEEKA